MYIRKAFGLVSKNLILIIPMLVVSLLSNIMAVVYMNSVSRLNMSMDLIAAAQQMQHAIGSILLWLLLIVGISMMVQAGQGNMIKQAILTGQADFSAFMPGVRKYFWRLVGQAFLSLTIVVAVILIVAIVVIAMLAGTALDGLLNGQTGIQPQLEVWQIITIILIFIGLVVGSLFLTLWIPAMIIDNAGVLDGLRMGASAVARHFWGLLGAIILFGIIAGGISYGLDMLYAVITGSAMIDIPPFTYMTVLKILIIAYLSTVIMSYLFIVYSSHRSKFIGPDMVEDGVVSIQPIDQQTNEDNSMPDEKQ